MFLYFVVISSVFKFKFMIKSNDILNVFSHYVGSVVGTVGKLSTFQPQCCRPQFCRD